MPLTRIRIIRDLFCQDLLVVPGFFLHEVDAFPGFFQLLLGDGALLLDDGIAFFDGVVPFQAEVDVGFDVFDAHAALLEVLDAGEPADGFFIEEAFVMFIALQARDKALVGVEADGVLGQVQEPGYVFDGQQHDHSVCMEFAFVLLQGGNVRIAHPIGFVNDRVEACLRVTRRD
jgi:hypothetical protein